ncbi:MAG TPA: DNA translocase FtsK 4TM domain-containing protein, partial [Steroidobacteraceae bacterium]|nr:DNA translocase FtsK 4TM domain-containing protein [Steroidobacteraceae bacterium]
MAESQAQARPIRFTAAVARGLRESAVIAIGVVAIVLLIALATYSPADSGFSFAGASPGVHNRIGPVGAWLADVLFFLFGRPAFLLPVMLGVSAWALHRGVEPEPASRMNSVVRTGGFLLLLAASCGLTTLHWQPGSLRETAGGVIGSLIGSGLEEGLGFLGATLLMLAAWMAGLSLSFGVSWFTVMDRLGTWSWAAVSWVRERRASAKDVAVGKERRAARRDSVASEQKRVAARTPPKIEPPAPHVEKSERVEKERQVPLFDPPKAGELPPLSLLDDPPAREPLYSAEALEALSRLVEMKLKDFGIDAE